MANELNIALQTSGLTVTAQRYQAGAAVGSAISLTEVGSSAFYSGNMTGAAGTYQIVFISSSVNVGSGSIIWDGTAEVTVSTFNAATDTVANVTTVATTTNLTNANPSAAAIATQVRTELTPELTEITETHLIHGLKTGSPLNVTPTARTAGAISQTITGDGVTTTTVTR